MTFTDSAATYLERGAKQTKQMMEGEDAQIAKSYAQFEAAIKQSQSSIINSANLAREIGIHLQTKCGHEQVGFDFWQKYCEGKQPFDFEAAKMFVSVANKMEKPAKTINEAVQYVQLALVAGGLLELPEREEAQKRASVSLFEKWLGEIVKIRQPFGKLTKDWPMDSWNKTALDKFLSETEWLVEERARAEKLKEAAK